MEVEVCVVGGYVGDRAKNYELWGCGVNRMPDCNVWFYGCGDDCERCGTSILSLGGGGWSTIVDVTQEVVYGNSSTGEDVDSRRVSTGSLLCCQQVSGTQVRCDMYYREDMDISRAVEGGSKGLFLGFVRCGDDEFTITLRSSYYLDGVSSLRSILS
ncbi:hypothetical protein Tco_0041128 [Tanacetum coccineum]